MLFQKLPATKKMFPEQINIRNINVQYLIVLAGLNLFKIFGLVNRTVGFIGGSILMTTIAWNLTKYLRTYYDREFLSTAKKAVLITGTESRVTNELAIRLNNNGYRVYATVKNQNQDIIDALVNNCMFVEKMSVRKLDVTDEVEINQLAQQISGELQTNNEELWAVINGTEVKEFGHFDWSDVRLYENLFNVNTLGTVRVVRAFLPLIRQSKGRIINIESIGSRVSLPKLAAYCVSKHANIAFADALRRELNESGIKVSTVELGFDRETVVQDLIGTGSTRSNKFNRSIRQQWQQTSDAVKKFYGQQYVKQLKIDRIAEIFQNNLDAAINDLIDAVRGQDPAIRYTPFTGLKARLFAQLAQVVPIEWLDSYYFLSEKGRPKPVPVVEKPVPIEEKPIPVEENPGSGEEKPGPVEEKPGPVEEKPVPMEEEPVPMVEKPVPVEEKPVQEPIEEVPEQPTVNIWNSHVETEKVHANLNLYKNES